MTENYFSKFPTISYNGYKSINIMSRVKLLDKLYNRPEYYYNIDLPETVRPDFLSNELYKDSYMSWLIYLSNNIVDPYYQWGMNQYDFNNFVAEKYGSVDSAQSKVAYWNNNWYESHGNISISAYNNLTDEAKKYFEPILVGNIILEYRRRQEDNMVNTNQIWQYSVSSDLGLSLDDKITLTVNNKSVGNGQVLFANSSTVRVYQVFGNVSAYTTNTANVKMITSISTTSVLTANMLATNIPLSEQVYWSPITYYDVEDIKNKGYFSVKALSENYQKQAALQLRRLLNP